MSDHVFHTAPTGKAWALGLFAVLVGLYLVWVGLSDVPRYGDQDPLRIPLAYGPIALGVVLILAAAWTAVRNTGCEVHLNGHCVRVVDRTTDVLNVGWEDLTHLCEGHGLLRTMMLSDGRRFVRLAELFMPRFAQLHAELEHQGRVVRTRTRHKIS